MNLIKYTSVDDKVEIIATFFGSFVVGASFSKDFFMHKNFEIKVFMFGLASAILFFSIFYLTKIRLRLFDKEFKLISLAWISVFLIGCYMAYRVLMAQFLNDADKDIGWQSIFFLCSYTVSTNLLFLLNRETLFEKLRTKTIYKYLLAPINGIGFGSIIMGIIMSLLR